MTEPTPHPLARLHLDTNTGALTVRCTCGDTFAGADPDHASSMQLDHVELVLHSISDAPAIRAANSARRAVIALGYHTFTYALAHGDAPAAIQDAISDLMHLAQLLHSANEDDDDFTPLPLIESAMRRFEEEL